jgi:hypothetical protein
VIGVVDPVVACPRSFEKNPIQPISARLLKEFPDTKSGEDTTIITPDYQLVFGVTGALAGFLILALTILYVRRVSGWGVSKGARPAYRQLAGKEDFHALATKKQRVKKPTCWWKNCAFCFAKIRDTKCKYSKVNTG